MQKYISNVCLKTPLLPILVGILTVVSMFAANADRLDWGQLLPPLIFVIFWAALCWFILWLMAKGRPIVVVVASITVLVTMLWDLFPQFPQKFILTPSVVQFLIWMGASIAVVKFSSKVNKAISLITGVVLLAIIVSLGQATYGIAKADRDTIEAQTLAQAQGDYPDIYFIIPDRFGSPDALKECGLSNDNVDWFVQELRDRGFYVREDALSLDAFQPTDKTVSTTRTLRFLASVLNFGTVIDTDIDYDEASRMVRSPDAIKTLHSMGYTCYNVGSWYPETAVSLVADYNYIYKSSNPVQWLYIQEFGAAVLDRSIWRYFTLTGNQTERDREMFQFDSVVEIAGNDISPKFVFAHILLPHPPFVWTALGEPQNSNADNMTKYLEQVVFTENYLLDMIDSIPDDAIVIIQSDEGICFTDKSENADLSNEQWEGVLMAWHIPDKGADELGVVGHTEILGYVVNLVGGDGDGE